jgi:hypothetical protein
MTLKPTTPGHLAPAAFFFLGCLEFGAAAVLILQFSPDPKNAVFFGYSLLRLALVLPAGALALWLLALTSLASYRARVWLNLESNLQKAPLFWGMVVFSLALLAFIILTIPLEGLGIYGDYFERARPLLFVFCLYPAQFSLVWLIKRDWRINWVSLRPEFISLAALFALGGLIIFSGLGITPEQDHWNVAGNPITSLQMLSILLTGVLVFGIFRLIKPQLFPRSGKYVDVLIILALFVAAVYLWNKIPFLHNEFSARPAAPSFQSFPASDARTHDLGALGVLNGSGILFRTYTDKPLYMVFLAGLHLFSGYDYNLLSFLQTCFLALMVPFLYVLGKSFHSRLFGFVLAGIVLVRQQNAIALSNLLNFNATPTQLLTEVPTLLGLIVFTYALFEWTRRPGKGSRRAFLVGGILGSVSLIRLNPFLLIPAVPIFLFLILRRRKKEWFQQSVLFLLGCAVLIAPWVMTGTDQSGRSFFIHKFFDVINVRYGPGSALPPGIAPELSLGAERQPTLSAGLALTPIDIHSFPGFVINHTLHNFVGSFLTLPDSLRPTDQQLDILMERPPWSLGKDQVAPRQIPFMLVNLGLLAIGLGWSWKSWKWAGLSPLLVFVVYSLSLGLGRTSGSRYLVPMDWVVGFYFALGLICLLQLLPRPLRHALEAEPGMEFPPQPAAKKPAWLVNGAILLVFCVAALVPAAQKIIPPPEALCQAVNPNVLFETPLSSNLAPGGRMVYGEILYPEIKKDRLSFGLLTCKKAFSFNITGFHGKLDLGQRVIVGLSGDGRYPRLESIILPPGLENPAQVLWLAEPK